MVLNAVACTESDDFSSSPSHLLTFPVDTISLDTVFSTVPTPTKSFWVYNRTGKDLRCTTIRLNQGNQTGFRVNVDGTYLSATTGYQTQDVEIRRGDSIRVYVELTSSNNHTDTPQRVSDQLIFSLESGSEQTVNLQAYSWDATFLKNAVIHRDTIFTGTKPIVIYGGLTVDSAATLTLAAGTTLYFHQGAAMTVKGTLKSSGAANRQVILRGDRLDHLFDYLPYDNTPGRWQGVLFTSSSYNNALSYTDIHSAVTGIEADSSDLDQTKLTLEGVTVHNSQGYGLLAYHSRLQLDNCLLSNALNDCACFYGGNVVLNNCTLAQFYPFSAERKIALRFGNPSALSLTVRNSLITGYSDDELLGEIDSTREFHYLFDHCLIRTPAVVNSDSIYFQQVSYEDLKDTARSGIRNFSDIDTENLKYDFHLDSTSVAIGLADPQTALPLDRDGDRRDENPDAGCYEFQP